MLDLGAGRGHFRHATRACSRNLADRVGRGLRARARAGLDREVVSLGPRHNRITIEREEPGNHFLRIESDDSSSVETLETDIDPHACAALTWRWRVDGPITPDDLTTKDGDDAPARLYVVFRSTSPWRIWEKRALVYVWDSSLAVGTILPNAWRRDDVRMIVRETGGARAGGWVEEAARLPDDFTRAFPGEEIGPIEGIVLAADTDGTHGHASAGFDDIQIRCAVREADPAR